MKIRYTIVATLAAAAAGCTNPADTEAPNSTFVPPVIANAVSSVSIGNTVTVSDNGWKSSFGGTMTVEPDATVIYAFVFGGSSGPAPVSGVSVGGQALTKVKSVTGPNSYSMDVYRLVTPVAGSGKTITVTRSKVAYDPVRVSVFTANTPGVANGTLRIWVNGVQALINSGVNDAPVYTERTNVMYYSAGQPAYQNRLEFEPTYGAGLEHPPYTQWFDIGHVTAAVK